MDQYLQCNTHHHIGAKYSIINKLNHRAKTVISTAEHLRTKVEHIKEVLANCKYPAGALECMECKNIHQDRPNNINNNTKNNNQNSSNKKTMSHINSICTGIMGKHQNICGKYCTNMYFKGNRLIKNILAIPKDKDPMQQKVKSGIIYWYKYNRVDCNDEYTGESGRTFWQRYKEHHSTFTSVRPTDFHWPPYNYGKFQHGRQVGAWLH